MVIWRGWGVLAFVFVLVAMMLCGGLASAVLPDEMLPFSAGPGLLLAAGGIWLTGSALNTTRPQRRIDEWAEQRRTQLDDLVDSGRFLMGPGQPPPASHEEAEAQSDALYEHELRQARRALNRHTLFFVPMQFWAVPAALAGVVVLVLGVLGAGSS